MIADLRKTWNILTTSERRRAVWMLLLISLMAATEMAGVLSVMPFLSVMGRPELIHENPVLATAYEWLPGSSDRTFLVALGIVSIATVVGASTFKALTLHSVNRFVHFLRHSISIRLLSRYLRQPYEYFLETNPSQLSRNVLSEVDHLLSGLIQPLSQMIAQGTVVAAMAALVLWYDPVTAIGIVVTVGILYSAIYHGVRRRLFRLGRERQAANGQRFQSCNEVLGGIKEVKITQATDVYLGRFSNASREFSRHLATGDTLAQTPLYVVEAVGYSGLILIALMLMLRNNDLTQVLPALGLYGFAAYRMLPAAQIMYRGFAKLKFSSAALETVHRDLMLSEEAIPAGSEVLIPQREIRLDNVTYAYPSAQERPVLKSTNLTIPVNSSVGIVGRSGAGKSTLMDILLGILSPQSGSLKVDDATVSPSNVAAWQRAIGYVPQHIYLSDASVAENIAFGVPRRDIDMAAVRKAAAVAQIHDFITNELNAGYDTPIGDRGVRLSGGQRQRIGIARALYRDPPVILMDEATSALDVETESDLNNALKGMLGKKTIIIVTHRDSFLSHCDSILSI